MKDEKKVSAEGARAPRKPYGKPTLKKHENLKKITLLSFTPPGN